MRNRSTEKGKSMHSQFMCSRCGIEAPTRHVTFRYVVAGVFYYQWQMEESNLCKRCVNRLHWRYTGVTLLGGWLGISIVAVPFFVLANLFNYARGLALPRVPKDASAPSLTQEEIERLNQFSVELVSRIDAGEPPDSIAFDLAPKVNATPGQIIFYIEEI